ncbi:MAG: hypothetical protein ABUT39_23700 [Acidobacteriota bacterium]
MASALQSDTKKWLVEQSEGILGRVAGKEGFGEQVSQLRNLVQIVQEESEVAVLRNFIRYQSGRKTTQKFWSLICDDVIRTLELIEARQELADEVLRKAAIQQFFGYLVRHYVYLDRVRRDSKPRRGDRR